MLSGETWEKSNLLVNGNFNQGLELWTVQTRGKAGVSPGNFRTITGITENMVAEFIINGPGMAKISQEVTDICPGRCYELSFFIRNAGKTFGGPGIFGADLSYANENGELLDSQSYAISNPSQLLVWTYHHLMTNEAPPGTKKIKVELYSRVKDSGNILHLLADDVGLRVI